MAKTKSKGRSSGGGGGKVIVLLVLVAAIAAGGWYVATHPEAREWLMHGDEATGASNVEQTPAPTKTTAPTASAKRLTKKMAAVAEDAPFSPSEDVFEAGARTYMAQCAGCHGTVSKAAKRGTAQFWKGHSGTHTLDDRSARMVYGVIAEGDATAGMPAFDEKLTEVQIWQLSLLLKSSALELPDPVKSILR